MTGSGRCSPISTPTGIGIAISPTGITIELAPGRIALEAQRFDRWEKGWLDGRFGRPIPALVGGLRTALYPRLACVANAWNERMGIDERYPGDHALSRKARG
jgi:hypothetical protein